MRVRPADPQRAARFERQAREALARGNAIRLERLALCRELKAGRLTLAAALSEPALHTMELQRLLSFLPGRRRPVNPAGSPWHARTTAAQLYRTLRANRPTVGELVTVGQLGDSERRVLIEAWQRKEAQRAG